MAISGASTSGVGGQMTRSQWLWIISTLTILATSALIFFGVYTPWQQKRERLENQFKEEQERFQVLAAIVQQDKQIKKEAVPVLFQGEISDFLSEIGRLSSAAALQIESITPQPETSFGPYYRKLQVRIEAFARFPEMVQFSYALEHHDPLFKLDQVEMGQEPTPYRMTTETDSTLKKVVFLVSTFVRSGERG